MKYIDIHQRLKKIVNYEENEIFIDKNIVVQNYNFESKNRFLLPSEACSENLEKEMIEAGLNKVDTEIEENIHFRYHIFKPANKQKVSGVIFMFHGFNEKYWSKYLTWAKKLVDETGKAVILFPIAFHMNRAPLSWSDGHKMFAISQQRKAKHPNVIHSTLSNVAISTRLHNKPQRFIWSGLQSYYDAMDFVEQIKSGKHPCIEQDASIDFFSYSIGCLFAQIVMMTNKNNYFEKSKFCFFCGGAVFNRLSPVSKFILDSEANVKLYSYIVEHLESHMKQNKMLGERLSIAYPEGYYFKSMLNYSVLSKVRENKFKEISERILAITLENDTVVPPYEIVNTLQGLKRNIPIRIEILDFSYPYKHEDPFPAIKSIEDEVDKEFNHVFGLFSSFLQ